MFTLLLKGYQSLLDVANHMHLFTKLNEATYLTTLKKWSELKFLERVKTHLLEEGNDCRIVYSNSFLAIRTKAQAPV